MEFEVILKIAFILSKETFSGYSEISVHFRYSIACSVDSFPRVISRSFRTAGFLFTLDQYLFIAL